MWKTTQTCSSNLRLIHEALCKKLVSGPYSLRQRQEAGNISHDVETTDFNNLGEKRARVGGRRGPDCRKKFFLYEVLGSSEILPNCEAIRQIAVELENYPLTCPTDFRMLWRGEREREWRDRFLLMMARQVWRLKLHLMPNCTTLQSLKRVGGRWIAARFNLCSW